MTGLGVVSAALRAAGSGAGSLMVVRGPLGCGRSAALKEAKRLAESLDVRVWRATGARQERAFPFGVVHQLTGGEPSASARPDVLHQALAGAGPVLVLVDDAQWADEDSLRALAWAAGRLDRLPVVMVVCVRDGDVWSGSSLVDQVVRQAAHVVALQRRPLAQSSQQKLVTCLRAQPPWIRSVLDAMAVLGEDTELIAPLAETDEAGCAAALRAMDKLGLVDEAVPRFAGRIVREVVEETMAPADRVRLQTRAVRLLHDAGRPAEVVAALLLEITFSQGLWAVEVLCAASASAMDRGAPQVAVEYLRRALLERPQADWRRATLLVELAAVKRGADRAGAAVHLSVAARMVSTTRERAAIAARVVPGALVEAPPAVRELLQGVEDELRAARPHDEVLGDLALRVEARSHHAECLTPDRCVDRLGERPDEAFPATSAGRELLSVRLHCATIASVWAAGDVAVLAQRLLAQVPSRPDHAHTPIATLVTTLCAAGSVDAAAGWLHGMTERSAAVAEQVFAEAAQVLVLLHSGRVAAARTAAENLLATTGTHALATEVLVTLASVACEARDEHLAARLVPLVEKRTHIPALSVAHQMLCAVTSDLRAGLAHLRNAGDQAEELGWRNPVLYPWRSEAARVLWRLGDAVAARELAARQHELAVEWGSAAGIGKALCHLGSMTHGEAGVAMLRQAAGVLEGSANRFELARALWQVSTRTADQRPRRRSWTAAQHRVVELALAGRSHQEIADVMRVGVRVVEKYLADACRKLGVQGHGELPGALTSLTFPDGSK